MSDLINKNEIIKLADGFIFTDEIQKRQYMDFLRYCVENAPTVETKPIVRGEWIEDQVETGDPFGNGFYLINMLRCSICGSFLMCQKQEIFVLNVVQICKVKRMIDEKKLIESLWGLYNSRYNLSMVFEYEDTMLANRIIGEVQQLIETQPKVGEWIPCSERLPEDTETKIVTLSNGKVEAAYYSGINWWCIGDSINLEVRTKEVIAWQPLPEPYEP